MDTLFGSDDIKRLSSNDFEIRMNRTLKISHNLSCAILFTDNSQKGMLSFSIVKSIYTISPCCGIYFINIDEDEDFLNEFNNINVNINNEFVKVNFKTEPIILIFDKGVPVEIYKGCINRQTLIHKLLSRCNEETCN